MLGVKDRGLEEAAPRQFPPAIMQLGPSIDHARNGDRIDAGLRHLRDAILVEMLNRKSLGCPPACVQAVDFAGLRLPIDGEEIAAHAVGSGFCDIEYSVGCDCGIDGGPTPFKDARSSLRGRNLTGGNHTVLRSDNGASV